VTSTALTAASSSALPFACKRRLVDARVPLDAPDASTDAAGETAQMVGHHGGVVALSLRGIEIDQLHLWKTGRSA